MLESPSLSLPLQGRRILVTRASEQAAALSKRLSALGAIPIEIPVIRIVPPQDWSALDAALARLYAFSGAVPYYAWLIFTSANAVRICCERLRALGCEPRDIAGTRVAAIGPATAAALERYGLNADLIPDTYIAESVAASLIAVYQQSEETLEGKRILLPRAAKARKALALALQQEGALVDEIVAYITMPVETGDEETGAVLAQLRAGQIDIITFTSSSTVQNFTRWLEESRGGNGCGRGDGVLAPPATLLQGDISYSHKPLIACIGPITAQAARERGLDVQIEADTFTIDGLVTAIVRYYRTIEQASLPS
jgi:uroporphyrinogen-III synthase